MLICGPTAVGKSTIGFRFFLTCVHAGLAASYVDLDQIGFLRPAGGDEPLRHRLRARNLAAIWQNYREAGATHLIATGPVDSMLAVQAYADELPANALTVCRLRAGTDDLRERILSRGAGGSWPQPGDPLRDQPAEVLARAATRAAHEATALDNAQLGDLVIETAGRTAAESALLIGRATKWTD